MTYLAERVLNIPPSVFAEINTLARQHNAVNLSQGAPDFDAPPEVVAAAAAALQAGGLNNQYAPSPGIPALRQAVADHARRFYGQTLDPQREVLVVAGASLGVFLAMMGLVNPGDEVIVFEPFFDTYVPNVVMAGGVPRYVPLRPPNWDFDPDELRAAFNNKTKAILINTPHNPTGKVYSREELSLIAELCQQWNVIAITDEVYEHLVYDGQQHVRLGTLPGMHERTLTISSLGKTFSVTGWKLGWAIGAAELVEATNRVHSYSIFTTLHPQQHAGVAALNLPDSYYQELLATYQRRRNRLVAMLAEAGLQPSTPQGGYFAMADFSAIFDGDDVAFARYMASEVGVACIPPTAFYSAAHRHIVQKQARFTFCKRDETLDAAEARLAKLRKALGV